MSIRTVKNDPEIEGRNAIPRHDKEIWSSQEKFLHTMKVTVTITCPQNWKSGAYLFSGHDEQVGIYAVHAIEERWRRVVPGEVQNPNNKGTGIPVEVQWILDLPPSFFGDFTILAEAYAVWQICRAGLPFGDSISILTKTRRGLMAEWWLSSKHPTLFLALKKNCSSTSDWGWRGRLLQWREPRHFF